MGLIVDPGTALLDQVNGVGGDVIALAGVTGLHERFGRLYNTVNGNIDHENIDLTDDYPWTGIHTIQSTDLHILSSGAAFDLIFAVTTVFTQDRTLTVDIGDANRTVTLAGNLTTAGAFITSGAFSLTLTATDVTNVTLPTTGTLATLAGAESLSNKTITAPKVTTGSYVDKGDSSTGTVTCDLTAGNIQRVRATGNFTLAFSNPGSAERFLIIIQQDGTGSRTVTWPTKIRWLNGTGATDSTTDKPTLTTTANKVDIFSFIYDSALDLYWGSVVGFKGAIS